MLAAARPTRGSQLVSPEDKSPLKVVMALPIFIEPIHRCACAGTARLRAASIPRRGKRRGLMAKSIHAGCSRAAEKSR